MKSRSVCCPEWQMPTDCTETETNRTAAVTYMLYGALLPHISVEKHVGMCAWQSREDKKFTISFGKIQ